MSTTTRTYNLRKRAQAAEDTRRRILSAARDLIESSGYQQISLDRIAEAAGVSRQTIYVQFNSKLGVLAAMVGEIRDDGLRELYSHLQDGSDPVEILQKVIPLDFAFMHENAKIFRIFRAQAVSDPDFRAVLDDNMAARSASLHALVNDIHRQGKLAPGWSVDEAADWLATITNFPAYDELVNKRGWTLDHLTHRTLETIEKILLVPGAHSKKS